MSKSFQHLYKEKNRKNERSHRANVLVELRNEKREDLLQRKRLEPKQGVEPVASYDNNTLYAAIQLCESNNNEDRVKGILLLRTAIYSDIPDCDQIVATPTFIRLMLSLLSDTQNEEIQFDSACVLANLTIKYKSVRLLLSADNIVKILFNYLNPSNARLCETTLLTIANIILENPNAINIVVNNNIMPICAQILNTNPPIHIIKNISYFLLNFTSKTVIKYGVNPGILSTMLPIIKYLIKSTDEKILSNVLWVIANINDTTVENIALIIESGILQTCKELLVQPPSVDILHPTLRIFGNVVTNDDEITQYVLNMDILPIVSEYIQHDNTVIQKECLWFISNVAAGNITQMALIFDGNLLSLILDRFVNGNKTVAREALWVLSNILYTGAPTQIQYMLRLNLIEYVCQVLDASSDAEIIFLCLEVFLFTYDNSSLPWNEITTQIELCGGLDSIDLLQDHPNKKIANTAYFILNQYISSDTSQIGDIDTDDFRKSADSDSFHF